MLKSILLVDDEIDMLFILGEAFTSKGYTVFKAKNGKEGLDIFNQQKPVIIITDIMMPNVNGLDMVREIRKTNRTVPIFFLSSLTSESNAIEGLGIGADDYIRKPFSVNEVVARAESAMERAYFKPVECIKLASLTFDPSRFRLSNDRQTIKLTGRQSKILQALAQNLGKVVSTEQILEATSSSQKDFFALRSLQVHITKLRQMLACEPALEIINERCIGYRLEDSSAKLE